ncbi:hypothetical protein [Acinetobacter variabilis]
MFNKLFLAISLSAVLVSAVQASHACEVAPCTNGFDSVNVCELRS